MPKTTPTGSLFSSPATDPESALALWKRITGGKHPLTREGVVIHSPTGKPQKIKQHEEHDVHVREIVPGLGKYKGVGAGAFRYSHAPEGPVVGEVGTGLSDELRRAMHADPAAFIGRVARVKAQEQFPSGALRAPALLALHEDEPLAKTAIEATGGRSDSQPGFPPPQQAAAPAKPLVEQPDEGLLHRCQEPFDPREFVLPRHDPMEVSEPDPGLT